MSRRNYSSLHISISKNLSHKLNQATHRYGLSKGEIIRQAVSQELNSLKSHQTNRPINNDKEVLKQLHTFYNGNLLNSLPIDERLNQHKVVKIANKIAKSNIPLTMSNAYYAIKDRNNLKTLIIYLFLLKPYIKKYLNRYVGKKDIKAIKSNKHAMKVENRLSNKYGNNHNHYHLPNFVNVKIDKLSNRASNKMKIAQINHLFIQDFDEPRSQIAWILAIKSASMLCLWGDIDEEKYRFSHVCKLIMQQKKYTYLEEKSFQYNSKSNLDNEDYDLIGHLVTYIPTIYMQSMETYWKPIAKGILHHKL